MRSDVLIYFIANIFINSILAFVISALMVEFFVFMFRLEKYKAYRTIHFLRLLPFIKIIYDVLFNFKVSSWAIANGVDIINRNPGSIMFNLGAIYLKPFIPVYYYFDFSIYRSYTFSLGDIITQNIGFTWTFYIVLFISMISITMVVYNLIRLFYSNVAIKLIISDSIVNTRKIYNAELKQKLINRNIKVFISKEEGFTPFSYGVLFPKIIIPSGFIADLTQEEFEALISHEVEHLGWWDTISNFVIIIISSFFWFIPFMRSYIKRVQLAKELACDKSCLKYYYSTLTLAELLQKAVYYVRSAGFTTVTPLFTFCSTLVVRVKSLMDLSAIDSGKANNAFRRAIGTLVVLVISLFVSLFVLNSRLGIM